MSENLSVGLEGQVDRPVVVQNVSEVGKDKPCGGVVISPQVMDKPCEPLSTCALAYEPKVPAL